MLWSPNCQLLYPFENQANDYSGNARHGTVSGSGVYATKPNGGRCLYFDGTGDYVATPSFGLSGTVVVFACWIRRAQHTVIQTYIGDAGQSVTLGYIFCYSDANANNLKWKYAHGTNYASATSDTYFNPPYNDAWLHLCVVCDYAGKNCYFYRNGLAIGSPVAMVGTPAFPSTARVKYIGGYGVNVYLLTYGYMANVQLWTLATMPPAGQMLANVNRLMLGMNPIW